ncbi:MAG TPA: hypothetical protein DCZ52_04435, partial [Lachnospiraceae bacterium]|nr:hypothetical protein [Lachnospiraceae bacterium]
DMEDRNHTEEKDERAEEQARKAKEARKSVSRRMIIYMVITLSFFLSLVGTGTSGHFTVRSWIDSFIISTSVSMLMGFVIPVRYIVEKVCAKYDLQEGDLNTRLVESLIVDLLFTPLMTFLMILYAYVVATMNGAKLMPLITMYLSSLLSCFPVGFILIFLLMPLFRKFILSHTDIGE